MSLSELWPQLSTLNAEQDGSSMAWKVLYAGRPQPLLVPLDIQQARHAIAFFMRNPLLRYWGNLMLTLDRWLPRAQLLPSVRLEHFPHSALFGIMQPHDARNFNGTALFCGFPGPQQKLTIYCPDANGGLGKVAKLALHASANEAITQEAHWLAKLNHIPLVASFLPRLLQQGALPCGRRYFSMRSLPPGGSPQRFGQPHYEFLGVLAKQKPVPGPWQQSQAYTRLYQRTQAVLPLVDEDLRQLWLGTLTEIEQRIGRTILAEYMMHGDFAPWNLRQIDAELFVFDWEYAQTSGNPLQDFLHFHLIPRALQRWPLRPKMMPALLNKAAAYADSQLGAESGVAAASAALTLHYLLDTMTFYVAASGYMDYTHPVLSSYFKLLQQRALWLPQSDTTPLKSHDFQSRDSRKTQTMPDQPDWEDRIKHASTQQHE